MSTPKTYLRRFTSVIDVDQLKSAIPRSLIEQLYANTTNCFPSEKEKTVKHYYLRLVKYLHNDIKRSSVGYNSVSRSKSSSSMSEADEVFEGPEYGFFFKFDADLPEEYALKNRWELFVLFEGHPNNERIAASCFVHFDDLRKHAEIEEVCVAIAGKKYCKEMIVKVVKHIQKHDANTNQVYIYCENNNIPACKCYQSVFASDELQEIKNATLITQSAKQGKPVTRFIYSIPIQRRSPSRSPQQSTAAKRPRYEKWASKNVM